MTGSRVIFTYQPVGMQMRAAIPKRERDPAATRQRLIDATVRLMLRQGFAATSVDRICGEAGLTKGSFFHHFESKEAVGKAAKAFDALKVLEANKAKFGQR